MAAILFCDLIRKFGFRQLPIYLCYKSDCNAYANDLNIFILLFLLYFFKFNQPKKRQTHKRQHKSGKAFPLATLPVSFVIAFPYHGHFMAK
jgi:hypothetical protein